MNTLEKFFTGALVFACLWFGVNTYEITTKAEQDKKNEEQWAQERAQIKNDRLERLYRVQCGSLDNIPYVAIESKKPDRMEKMWRLQLIQQSKYGTNSR